jgi:hypothetical protein
MLLLLVISTVNNKIVFTISKHQNKSKIQNLLQLLRINTFHRVKKHEMGRACSTNGEKRNAYRILVGKP